MQSRNDTRATGLNTSWQRHGGGTALPKRTLLAAAVSVLMAIPVCATAQLLGELDLRINGFLTAGATISDSHVQYLSDTTNDISFQEDSVFGLQVGVSITDELSLDAQVLAAGDEGGEFDARVDWAFATFRFNDNVAVRGGRIRLPVLLVSEYQEVGYAYPWVRPPQELYERIPFNGVFGGDVLLSFDAGPGQLLVQPFVGTVEEDTVQPVGNINTDVNKIFGGVVAYEHDYFLVRA